MARCLTFEHRTGGKIFIKTSSGVLKTLQTVTEIYYVCQNILLKAEARYGDWNKTGIIYFEGGQTAPSGSKRTQNKTSEGK